MSESRLRELLAHEPRVADQLYHNLSGIVARRLVSLRDRAFSVGA